ncbi:FitA-like ribbon-helix-helix domain-containing protein [Azospirillum picis]|uniref:Plasmid stability protein n=1 Tax=Azospirillum picis TaxID=488438 RepID=A0ABU0MCQ1_9PROT|nr:plasmid stabilization protein [Azospirillum picis]MBP2297777.1 plasmid stability protein [Azospirillum picis]MDQ0531200.1 plasmid stability protein [Azospirillum picis]
MGDLTIRNLEEPLAERLQSRAAHHGRSMEDEARLILQDALTKHPDPGDNLADAIRRRFQRLGGVEMPEVPQESLREPPAFE